MRKPTKPTNEAHKIQEPRLLASSELQQVTGGNVLKTRHDTVKNP